MLEYNNGSTIWIWLACLGCFYGIRRKTYYVDAHEKPEKIVHWRYFIKRCLESEIRMHCWINLTSAKVASLKEKYPTLENVKHLSMPSSDELEFFIDSHESLLELVNELHDFGGCVSFRKNPNEKPLISIDHDEEIVKKCVRKYSMLFSVMIRLHCILYVTLGCVFSTTQIYRINVSVHRTGPASEN